MDKYYAPVTQYFCRYQKPLSFSLNKSTRCAADFYHYHYTYNTIAGRYHFFPGNLAEEYDPA